MKRKRNAAGNDFIAIFTLSSFFVAGKAGMLAERRHRRRFTPGMLVDFFTRSGYNRKENFQERK
jgi:hypothetical protein